MIKEKMIPKGLSRTGRCRERGRGKKIGEKVLENRNGEIGESRTRPTPICRVRDLQIDLE